MCFSVSSGHLKDNMGSEIAVRQGSAMMLLCHPKEVKWPTLATAEHT